MKIQRPTRRLCDGQDSPALFTLQAATGCVDVTMLTILCGGLGRLARVDAPSGQLERRTDQRTLLPVKQTQPSPRIGIVTVYDGSRKYACAMPLWCTSAKQLARQVVNAEVGAIPNRIIRYTIP